MKTYRGKRNPETGDVTVTVDDRPLDPRFGIANHSPTGFEWGYAGSGPAQLALALCCDALGDDERAQRVYQFFKDKALVRLDVDTWVMTDAQVRTAVELIERLSLGGGAA